MLPSSTPARTSAPQASSTTDVRSRSSSHEAPMPATGTSIENGATVLDGYLVMSRDQMPYPNTVEISTM